MKFCHSCMAVVAFCAVPLVAGALIVDPVNGPYTTIRGANRDAEAGDTVLVRGGVYEESINVTTSGTAGNYITYRAYPGEKAILDGSRALTGWERCASAADCGGNPAWNNIFKANAGRAINALKANLFEGEKLLALGQYPQPSDAFFDNTTDEFRLIQTDGLTLTTLRDDSYFTQDEDDYWVGAYCKVLTGNNFVYEQEVTASSASGHSVTFASLPSVGIEYGKDKFAMCNHISLVDEPGEYYVDEVNRTVYLWPLSEASLAEEDVRWTYKSNAFLVDREYVRIEGFVIRRYFDICIYSTGGAYLEIRDNELLQNISPDSRWTVRLVECTGCLVEDNYIHHNKYFRGMLCMDGSDNTVRNNLLEQNGGTGVNFYGETDSRLQGNHVVNHCGQHSNGLTCYMGNRDVVLEGNYVYGGGAALTYQEINGLTVTNNYLDGNGGWTSCCWTASNTYNVTFLHNTLTTDGTYAFRSQSGSITNLVFRDNIVHGIPDGMAPGTLSHNIYTNPSYNASPSNTGELRVTDLDALYRDPDGMDFRLTGSSAAVDAGTNAGVTEDFYGTARPYGGKYDIGYFEYPGSGADWTRPTVTSVAATPGSPKAVTVVFSEALNWKTARVTDNYLLSGDVTVTGADLGGDGRTVTLATSRLTDGETYTLTVRRVQDPAGNPVASGTQGSFTYIGTGGVDAVRPGTAEQALAGVPNPVRSLSELPRGLEVLDMAGRRTGPTAARNGVHIAVDTATGAYVRIIVVD